VLRGCRACGVVLLADSGLILGNFSKRGPPVDLSSRHQQQHTPKNMAQGHVFLVDSRFSQ
jgi:hypothetical protein